MGTNMNSIKRIQNETFKYLSHDKYIMVNKKRKQNGKGIIDSIANSVLSSKHNRLLLGERHQVIYLPDETYNPAR